MTQRVGANCCNFLGKLPCWSGLAAIDQDQSDPNWKKVVLLKHDRHGQIVLDRNTHHPLRRHYIQDMSTGDLYTDDDMATVATKCAWLLIGIPLYTYCYMAYNLARIVFDIGAIACATIQQMGRDFSEKTALDALSTLIWGFLWEIPKAIVLDLCNVVRAPFFSIAMMAAAFYGVCIHAYDGKKYIAIIEHEWQHRVSYKLDFRALEKSKDEITCLEAFVRDVQRAQSCYLAFCMQVQANRNEPISTLDPRPKYILYQIS